MADSGDCLGICFADHQLLYAVNTPATPAHLHHIGCIDFNFPVLEAISGQEDENFKALRRSLSSLQEKYNCTTARMLSPAIFECWSVFPRLVYETPDEREDHLLILMDGLPRNEIETTWYELSNQDFKLLMMRNRNHTENYSTLLAGFSETDFVSEFELGMEWQRHTEMNGSYLTVNCTRDHLAISSYLLGKLRGATYIPFDTVNDLPYLWTYYGKELGWMNGIHEQVYVYGQHGMEVVDVMKSFFTDTGQVELMNNLDVMQVEADEKTYGFKLESSFPSIILSLNYLSSRHENPDA